MKIMLKWVEGVRGIILVPDGNEETIYELGLCKETNNQVKALALYQGLKFLDPICIKKI